MGRKCLWERFYFLLKRKTYEAFRRNSKEMEEVRIGDSIVPAWYYSPHEFQKLFYDGFRKIQMKPVGLFIPPSYLNPFFAKKIWLLSFMNGFEKLFSFSFLSNYADHFFIEFTKR
jgi:hypothetical protein